MPDERSSRSASRMDAVEYQALLSLVDELLRDCSDIMARAVEAHLESQESRAEARRCRREAAGAVWPGDWADPTKWSARRPGTARRAPWGDPVETATWYPVVACTLAYGLTLSVETRVNLA
jgi:hypothetical protein